MASHFSGVLKWQSFSKVSGLLTGAPSAPAAPASPGSPYTHIYQVEDKNEEK